MKHTPGPLFAIAGDVLNPDRPWGIVKKLTPEEAGFDHDDPDGQGRTVVVAEVCDGEPGVAEADAKLFAAAPRMLAALQQVQRAFRIKGACGFSKELCEVTTAINLATKG